MVATHLYAILLRLYPAAFRDEYGEEMHLVLRDRLSASSGLVALLVVWFDVITDTVQNAFRIHWDLLRQDMRYTMRTLARSPGFALTAVTVTALGIGANTAVFSIADHVFLRPLPFADGERLVKLWENVPRYTRLELSPANYRDWRSASTSFESMAAFHMQSVNLIGEGDPLRLNGWAVEAELFPILGVEPFLGRHFTTEDADEGAPETVVLSYGLWQGGFGGARDVVGRTIRLDDSMHTIIGVMPPDFFFPNRGGELWSIRRFVEDDFQDRDNNYLQALAKLRPDVTVDEARVEMDVITERLERDYPEENAETRATVVALRDEVTYRSRMLLIALVGASFCVLLIACTNLANLLLTRAIARRRELTVRTALGGGRKRLVRQLLTESLVLAATGGLLGIGLASAAVPLLSRLVPTRLPIGEVTALDLRVIAFALVLTAVTGLAFGVLPAMRGCHIDLGGLKEGARSGIGGRRGGLRAALVVAQVTASIVLLIASGLLVRALWQIQAVHPGFSAEGVLAVHTPLPMSKYAVTTRRAEFYDRVLTEVRATGGVLDAAYVSFLPMVMRGGIWPITVAGHQETSGTPETASLRFVTPRFFSTMDIPMWSGRDVGEGDTGEAPYVAVVSESFAERYWPEQDPLGQSFHVAFRDRLVVGVVADIRVRGLEGASEPQVYLPYRQVPDGGLVFYAPKELVVRVDPERDPRSLGPEIRGILRAEDAELPIAEMRTLDEIVREETAPRSTQIAVVGLFAGLSLLLSGIGIYGLLSFGVAQRRSELGVRIALGARTSNILAMVLREGAILALLGSVFGAVLGYGAGRAMEALLAGVRPGDLGTYTTAAGVFMTLAGSLLPALRATRVDPIQATRVE
ncbi:MAG: ABC transporter permease [Acidobacteria bacterium]|nr:MAG: ABC transporter permease [Acidobacteriota bacterium]